MALINWLLHKNFNNQSNPRLQLLANALHEYTLSFEFKKQFLRNHHALDSRHLRIYLPLFHSLLLSINKELASLAVQKDLIQALRVASSNKARVQSVLQRLKRNLNKQEEAIAELQKLAKRKEKISEDDLITGNVQEFFSEIHSQFQTLWFLVEEEQQLFFEDEATIAALSKQILQKRKAIRFERVSYPALSEAAEASRYLNVRNNWSLDLSYIGNIPHAIAKKKCAVAFYPASESDLSILFCFPNASVYVLQDPQGSLSEVFRRLQTMEEIGMIQFLKRDSNVLYFTFNKQKKILFSFLGSTKGFSDRFTPPIIKEKGIGALMVKFYTVEDDLKQKIFARFSPYLERGAFVHCGFVCPPELWESFVDLGSGWLQKK